MLLLNLEHENYYESIDFKGSVNRLINLELRGLAIDRRSIIPLFRFCSFAAAAAISLSSVADAVAVAADRFTTAVAAGGGKRIRRNYELMRIVD